MRMAALIGAILLIVVAIFQGEGSSNSWFAIKKIKIKGDLKYTSEEQLISEYSALFDQSLLTISMPDVLSVVLSSEWVASAEIRKVWPNTLQVLVHEYTPLAYWMDGQLISTSAAIFKPVSVPNMPLPKLYGPAGSSDIVLEQFGLISQALAPTSLRIFALTLEARGAWNVTFTNSISVKLGREAILERLQRFIAVYKSDLSGRIDQIRKVDARYPHGVAVAWKKNN